MTANVLQFIRLKSWLNSRLQFALAAISLLAWLAISPVARAANPPLRVATWNFGLKPGGGANALTPDAEASYIQLNADFLKSVNPDVILVQQIATQDCQQLVDALKPEVYHVLICSSFWDARAEKPAARQVAILSKSPAAQSWAQSWESQSSTPSFGGVAFAAIQVGSQKVGFLSVQVGDDAMILTNESGAPIEEFAGKEILTQLAQHITSLHVLASNNSPALVLAGDFNANTNASKFFRKKLLPRLKKSGFDNAFPGHDPGKNGLLNGPDCIVVRDVGVASNRQMPETVTARYRPITCDFDMQVVAPPPVVVATKKPAPPVVVEAAAPKITAAAVAAPVRTNPVVTTNASVSTNTIPVPIATHEAQTNWTAITGIAAVLIFALAWLLRPRSSNSRSLVVVHPPDGQLGGQTPEQVQAGLMGQMSRWLKQRAVRQLVSDRSELINTQNVAAEKMLAVDERLANVERQIQLQNQGYEQRIAILQTELATAKEENRELIKAQIRLLQLEMEKSRFKSRAPLN